MNQSELKKQDRILKKDGILINQLIKFLKHHAVLVTDCHI